MAIGSALIAVVALTGAASIWLLRERAIEDWRTELSNLSLIIAENTTQTMASAHLVLDSIAEDIRGARVENEAALVRLFGTRQAHQKLNDKVRGLPQIEVAGIVDAGGNLVNFSGTHPAPDVNLGRYDYFEQHRSHTDPGVFLSMPVRNHASGKWIFHLSRRLNDVHGRFAGVAVIGISCDYLVDFFKTVSLGEGAAIALYRQDYTMLARWPAVEHLIGKKNIGSSTWIVMEQGKDHDVILNKGPRLTEGNKPVSRMSAPRRVRSYPLFVGVTITEELYLAGWRKAAWIIGGITLGSIGALIVAFSLMANMLKRREQDTNNALSLKAQADAASEEKSRFLAMISHEIRTPMNGIVGMTELMLETRLDSVQKAYAGNVLDSAQTLMRIIDDILDFSKVEAGRMEVNPAPFDPASLTQNVAMLHRASAMHKGLQMDVRIDHLPPRWLVGDPVRIGQVLGNLVSNAIKFTAAGSVMISLRSRAVPGTPGVVDLTFEVTDTGIGIGEEARHKLFEPFTQVHRAARHEYGGTGLGLAICKRLVELMGGWIACESTPGEGAVFRFGLRCAVAMQEGALPPHEPQQPQQPLPAAGCRVLVAEDTEINRQLVRVLLTRLGCHVDLASNGIEALDALAKNRYDLVLMDCMMPQMDGYEATRRLRAREAEAGVERLPVIALTANAIEGDRERCLECGMDDYLAKPFTAAEFNEVVGRWISRLTQSARAADPS